MIKYILKEEQPIIEEGKLADEDKIILVEETEIKGEITIKEVLNNIESHKDAIKREEAKLKELKKLVK